MSLKATDNTPVIPDNFIETVEEYLQRYPLGFKEYDLIEHLAEKNFFQFGPHCNSISLKLFYKHFLLFHALYLISERMVKNKSGSLKITPLLIQKLSYGEAETALGEFDPMREYYMDLNNMNDATEETVDDLLTSFWMKYLANDKRQEALETLGLSDPVDDQQIKSTYRRLVKTHHPDKGGEKEIIQALNQAYAVLIKA